MVPPGVVHSEADLSPKASKGRAPIPAPRPGVRTLSHESLQDQEDFSQPSQNSGIVQSLEHQSGKAALHIHIPAPPDVRQRVPEESRDTARRSFFIAGKDAPPPVLTLEDLDLEAMTRLTVASRSPLSADGERWAEQRISSANKDTVTSSFTTRGAPSRPPAGSLQGENESGTLLSSSALRHQWGQTRSPISPLLAPEQRERTTRTYKRKIKKMKRVIDLFTYSPYLRTRLQFGIVRAFIALYMWASLGVSIPLWELSSQFTRGSLSCKPSSQDTWSGLIFCHPVFWNLLFAAIKYTLAAYLNLQKRNPRVRVLYKILEHVSLPGTIAYSIYFWCAHKELVTSRSLGLALNNHFGAPFLMMLEIWLGKTPFSLEQAWGPIVYLLWQSLWVFVYSRIRPGCFLLPALNPERNVVWVAYPGLIILYLFCFFAVYTLTQVRDHVAPCGQQVFPPAKYTPKPASY